MAHDQQQSFCKFAREKFPNFFSNKDVLDAGSYDVNGNNRYLFENCSYLGIDVAPGRNVDVVSIFHQFEPNKKYDVIVSTEMLEHDKYWNLTLRHMMDLLKSGGFLLLCCATTGRAEHGTARVNEPNQGNGQQTEDEEWKNYYRNITPEDIMSVIDCESEFSEYIIDVTTHHGDLYFYGIKK